MGQEHVKRALEAAASGGHNVLMIGPPSVDPQVLCPKGGMSGVDEDR